MTHLCALPVGTNSEPPVLAEPLVAADVIYLNYGHRTHLLNIVTLAE
jgi:hypothetical protein